MKKIILTIIIVGLTIMNLFLFKDYYKKREEQFTVDFNIVE